jgi:hypothetical protein
MHLAIAVSQSSRNQWEANYLLEISNYASPDLLPIKRAKNFFI